MSFIVCGGIFDHGCEASDIDLFYPLFEDEFTSSDGVDLSSYEELSREAGKPVEVFFEEAQEGFNLRARFADGNWNIGCAFFGKQRALGTPRRLATKDEIVAAARETPRGGQ